MTADIETSHGLATKEYVIEQDLPYWRAAAEHAIEVYNNLAAKVGQAPFTATQKPTK